MKADNNDNTIEETNQEVLKLTIENFNTWLENKFNEKYDQSLESLKERFFGMYRILTVLNEHILFVNADLIYYSKELSATYKPLIDNMIRLMTMMFTEYPNCLDLEFVEHFFLSVQERIQIYLAHFHQIKHIVSTDPNQPKHFAGTLDPNLVAHLCDHIQTIDAVILKIPNAVLEIQKRAELSVPLLKYIRDCKLMFRTPLKKLKEELEILSTNKSFEEYELLLEDVKNRSKGNLKFKMDFINKMIDLVKEACQYQFELNQILKPYFGMANAIKTKGKKFLNENLKSTDQAKIFKYVPLLLRQDFNNNVLPNSEVQEIVYIIKLLESQSSLVNEYKKSLVKGIEEFYPINIVEFEIIVEKYKMVMVEINNFQEFVQKNFEVGKFNKETINQVMKDIKRVVDKYKEFQNGIYHYQEILELFQKIRNLAGKFCYNEFNIKVELICEYNL
jgi:methanogenic corrinoid protein MtbC1